MVSAMPRRSRPRRHADHRHLHPELLLAPLRRPPEAEEAGLVRAGVVRQQLWLGDAGAAEAVGDVGLEVEEAVVGAVGRGEVARGVRVLGQEALLELRADLVGLARDAGADRGADAVGLGA